MKPFLSGRSVSNAHSLQPLAGARPASASGTGGGGGVQHAHAETKGSFSNANVECVKQGDKVVRLIVTCTCGERIEIDCLYPPGT